MQAAGAEVLGHFASTGIGPISPDFRDSAGSLREDRTLILSFQSGAEQGREEISHSYEVKGSLPFEWHASSRTWKSHSGIFLFHPVSMRVFRYIFRAINLKEIGGVVHDKTC